MNTKVSRSYIEVQGIAVEVVRKDIKNLHIAVYPPNGHVRVAAPLAFDDTAVQMAVIWFGWIRRQQATFTKQDRRNGGRIRGRSTVHRWRMKVGGID